MARFQAKKIEVDMDCLKKVLGNDGESYKRVAGALFDARHLVRRTSWSNNTRNLPHNKFQTRNLPPRLEASFLASTVMPMRFGRTPLTTRQAPTGAPGVAAEAEAGVVTTTPPVGDPRVAKEVGTTSANPGPPVATRVTPTQPRGVTPTSGVLDPKLTCKGLTTTDHPGLPNQNSIPCQHGNYPTLIQSHWTGTRHHSCRLQLVQTPTLPTTPSYVE